MRTILILILSIFLLGCTNVKKTEPKPITQIVNESREVSISWDRPVKFTDYNCNEVNNEIVPNHLPVYYELHLYFSTDDEPLQKVKLLTVKDQYQTKVILPNGLYSFAMRATLGSDLKWENCWQQYTIGLVDNTKIHFSKIPLNKGYMVRVGHGDNK